MSVAASLLLAFVQTDQTDSAGWVLIVAVSAISLVLYFLPTIVGRQKHNAGAIFVLNLLLGWTIIGWVVAMVWAVTKEPQPSQVIVNPSAPPPAILCSSCGKYSQAGSKFCANCGIAL